MGNAKHIGRIGALAVAPGIRNVRRTATRMTVSIGVAVLVVMATVVPAPSASPCGSPLSADSTALILGGTSVPTSDDSYVEVCQEPVHRADTSGPDDRVRRGDDARGVLARRRGRSASSGLRSGPPSIFGPGGAGWPDEPLWKLSGLFDLTFDQSVQDGVADLEAAMAEHGNDHLVIYGYSQGAVIANRGEAQARRAVPGGNQSPRHRLRAER